MSGVRIGKDCNIGQNVVIAPGVTIGNNVKIQNNVSIYSGVILEDDVSCGPSVVFASVTNTGSHTHKKHEFKSTRIKKGATIDANATIVRGNTIGSHAFIEAGTVVTKDVPGHALVLGNPARVVGWVCECRNHLDFKNDIATCDNCEKQFIRHEGGIKCIECECSNSLDFQNNANANDDGRKQLINCKEDNEYYEKERKLPQAADFV